MQKNRQHSNVDVVNKELIARQETETAKMQVATSVQTIHRGPLPSPKILKEYNDVCPGAAERIISMVEEQATHRQKLESQVVSSQVRNSRLGVIFAFLIAVITIIAGAVTAILGSSPWAGALLGSTGLAGLVGTFIYGTNSNKKERQEKEVLKNKNND